MEPANTSRPAYDAGTLASDIEREINQHLAAEQRGILLESAPPPPRVRIGLKRLASGEWQPDWAVESFDDDPATPDGMERIERRLLMVDSIVRDCIHVIATRDAEGRP